MYIQYTLASKPAQGGFTPQAEQTPEIAVAPVSVTLSVFLIILVFS